MRRAICQLAEQPTQAIHANGHRANGRRCHSSARLRVNIRNRKRRKMPSRKQARRMQVICHAANSGFVAGQQVVDKSPIRSRARHHGEVPNLAIELYSANRNSLRCAIDLLQCGLYRVERETQMPSQCIRASQRNDPESCGSQPGFRNKPLNHLVDSSVPSTSEYDICPIADRLPTLICGGPCGRGCYDLDSMAQIGKRGGNLTNLLGPPRQLAA